MCSFAHSNIEIHHLNFSSRNMVLILDWWIFTKFCYFQGQRSKSPGQIFRQGNMPHCIALVFFQLIESYQQYVNRFPLSLTVLSVIRYLWMKILWDTNTCAWFCNILYINAKICIMLNVNEEICIMLNVNEDRTDVSNFRFL